MELDKVGQGAQEQTRHAIGHEDDETQKPIQRTVEDTRIAGQTKEAFVNFNKRRCDHNHQGQVHVAEQLYEEFAVVKANAIVDPRAVMVHV